MAPTSSPMRVQISDDSPKKCCGKHNPRLSCTICFVVLLVLVLVVLAACLVPVLTNPYTPAMSYHKVFVYGTLKKGEPNNHLFSNDSSKGYWKFIGEGTTVEKYPLIIGTNYNIPFLLFAPGVGNNVHGEIYEVDDQMLASLDELEEHPTFYERMAEPIRRDDDIIVDCSVYFLKKFRPELLNQTLYSNYSSLGDHGLPYIDRYLRDPTQPAKQSVYLAAS